MIRRPPIPTRTDTLFTVPPLSRSTQFSHSGGIASRRSLQRFSTDFRSSATKFMRRSEEHPSELQSLMRISYAVFCLKKQNKLSTPCYYTSYPKPPSLCSSPVVHTNTRH